jgi:hypothetical protein
VPARVRLLQEMLRKIGGRNMYETARRAGEGGKRRIRKGKEDPSLGFGWDLCTYERVDTTSLTTKYLHLFDERLNGFIGDD